MSNQINVVPDDNIEISVATSLEHLIDSFKIRCCAFVAEQDCPMDDEFDGNDYCGTHILVWLDGKPVATTRLRYFADFVKVERIAVLKQHRNMKIFLPLLYYIRDYVESKGFKLMYTQADYRMRKVYSRFGFEIHGNGEIIEHFGSRYVAMVRNSEAPKNQLTINVQSGHQFLNSVEGSWLRHA